jgi:ribonucleoside-diphosphate reductase alpha chain
MRFDPEGITQNPEIPFAKSLPDYIMRWLASRFIEDAEVHEELGILTSEVRARKEAQQTLFQGQKEDGNGSSEGNGHAEGNGHSEGNGNGNGSAAKADAPVAPTEALTDTPPVIPAKMEGRDLGPACEQCGGMMQRTGSCYTCSSCGNNTGCG